MKTILIIGGGPAGSLAGLLLARRGFHVTLIEQSRFPRDKVCGECLSAVGLEVLGRHDLADRLRLRGAIAFTRTLLHTTNGTSISVPLPREMLGISRCVLDAELLSATQQSGVAVLQPARCESLQSTKEGVLAAVRTLPDNVTAEHRADIALLADGKRSLIGNVPPQTRDFGLKAHFAGVAGPRDAIELFGVVGHYGGLAAVEGDRWNASFSVPAERLKQAPGDLDGLFAAMVAENPVLTDRMKHATRTGDWHCSPLPRFGVAGDWPTHIIPIGNAAAAMEPIGGEGMGLALRSAELAAQAIEHDWPAAELRLRYRELWTHRRLACRAVAQLMSSPAWASRALAWSDPQLTEIVLRWMGK